MFKKIYYLALDAWDAGISDKFKEALRYRQARKYFIDLLIHRDRNPELRKRYLLAVYPEIKKIFEELGLRFNKNSLLYFDPGVVDYIKPCFVPEKDWVVLDCGAGCGDSSLMFNRFGCKVFAIEASKERYIDLLHNIQLNNAEGIIPIHVKLSKEFTIDECVKEKGIQRVNMIKIDVEGDEKLVIEGMEKTLGTFKPKIIIETHSNSLKTYVINFFQKRGYVCIQGRRVKGKEVQHLFFSPTTL